jgi:SNF2 family DNA or RNA helicase
VENQATDRAYRIGQEKPVFVYKLMTLGTVEEKIMAMQQRKSNLLSGIFKSNGGEGDLAFSSEDLEALFEPIS